MLTDTLTPPCLKHQCLLIWMLSCLTDRWDILPRDPRGIFRTRDKKKGQYAESGCFKGQGWRWRLNGSAWWWIHVIIRRSWRGWVVSFSQIQDIGSEPDALKTIKNKIKQNEVCPKQTTTTSRLHKPVIVSTTQQLLPTRHEMAKHSCPLFGLQALSITCTEWSKTLHTQIQTVNQKKKKKKNGCAVMLLVCYCWQFCSVRFSAAHKHK